jgi:hypothetical protein
MFSPGELVSIEVTVENQGVAIAGATVQSTITTANGNQILSSLTTDQFGKATITYRVVVGRDGEGKYTVEATANKDGYDPGSDSLTFQVKR